MPETSLKCEKKVGCHSCILSNVEEEMMLLYAALKQFIAEPPVFRQRALDQAVSLKRMISDLIVTNYKEDQNGYPGNSSVGGSEQ